MWIAEFKVWHSGSRLLEESRGMDAFCTSVYLNMISRGGKDYVTKVLVAGGRQAVKMVGAIKRDPRLRITHVEGNQVFYENTSKSLFHAHVFNSKVFFVKPFVMKRGFEYWTIASWDKRELLELKKRIARLKGKATIELLSMRRAPVNLFMPALFEKLTHKQLAAFLAAVNGGYYSYPHGASLKQLATRQGVPEATFREHLRKAEAKLLPRLAQDMMLEPTASQV